MLVAGVYQSLVQSSFCDTACNVVEIVAGLFITGLVGTTDLVEDDGSEMTRAEAGVALQKSAGDRFRLSCFRVKLQMRCHLRHEFRLDNATVDGRPGVALLGHYEEIHMGLFRELLFCKASFRASRLSDDAT